MAKIPKRMLIQEVNELTAMLCHEPLLNGLRQLLTRKKLNPTKCLLAGFLESENGKESGVIVAPGKKVFEYERHVGSKKQKPKVLYWREVTDAKALAEEMFPALLVGIDLMKEVETE